MGDGDDDLGWENEWDRSRTVAVASSLLPFGGILVLLNVLVPWAGWSLAVVGAGIFGAGLLTLLAFALLMYKRNLRHRGRTRVRPELGREHRCRLIGKVGKAQRRSSALAVAARGAAGRQRHRPTDGSASRG